MADDSETSRKAADLRGQAKAFTVLGGAATLGMASFELLPLFEGITTPILSSSLASSHKLSIASAAIGLVSAMIAIERHTRAHHMEARPDRPSSPDGKPSWVSRVENGRSAANTLEL